VPRLDYAARRMYWDAFDGWHAQAFESNDGLAAEYGLELRHPFHDRRVIEFAFAIPASQRQRNGLSKFVLRQAMRGRLPDSVLHRTDKAEFSLLFVRALERLGGSEGLADSGITRAGWVVPAELARKYAAVRSACNAGSDCFDGHLWPLWMVRALEIWHNNAFLETGGRVREPPRSTAASRTIRGH
jgi:asparagine synthase (glutamine-hydrolysing)